MDVSLLNLLRCPETNRDQACSSRLTIDGTAAEPLFFAGEGAEDLREGVLRCEGCGTRFPVICGVPILLRSPGEYLRSRYWFLSGFAGEVGLPLNAILPFLRKAASEKGQLPPRQLYDRRWSTRVAKFVSSYLISHHLGLEHLELLTTAQRRLALEMAVEGGPHDVLQRMLADLDRPEHGERMALDVGCSVGGMTARLAAGAKMAVGVDISFESLVWARALLCGRPGQRPKAPVFTEGDNRIEVALEPRGEGRCEFVLAGGEALPFAHRVFQVVTSCNLIDVMEKPGNLLDEKERVLTSDGTALLSTPFLHTAAGVGRCLAPEGRQPGEVLRRMFDERGFDIAAEQEDVPWVLFHYRRRLDFYLTHCMAAVRRAAGEG